MQKGKGKGSPYSITEHRAAELILVLGSQPAGDVWVINPAVGCHYFPPGPQLSLQPLRGLLPISLLGEQRHDGCEQFAQDCYPTALRLRFEPRPFCAWVQHANHSATKPPYFYANIILITTKLYLPLTFRSPTETVARTRRRIELNNFFWQSSLLEIKTSKVNKVSLWLI